MLPPSIRWPLCCITLLALLVMAGSRSSAQVQVTVVASKDNTLYQDNGGALSSGVGEYFFVGRTNGASIRRALVAFDIAGNIPQNAVIVSVTLTLNMSRTSAGGQQIGLYTVLADWGEGTSNAGNNGGGGAAATTGDATWVHRFFSSSLWSNPGGDFAAAPSATQTVSGIGAYTWGSTTQMVNDVRQWLNAPSSNFGWIVRGNESANQTTKQFGSKNNVIQGVRPQLSVAYQQPVSVNEHGSAPGSFALLQNYPNPFNSTTVVSYSVPPMAGRDLVSTDDRDGQLPVASDVRLAVYDILGREVTTLVNEVKQPGVYAVRWDATRLGSGIYFYRIQAGSFVETKKLTLLR